MPCWAGSMVAGRGLVYHLAIAEEHRKQGIGALLMDELEKRLRVKGCIRTYLLVTYDNAEAMEFYEKHGWQKMDLHLYGKDIA